MTHVFPQDIPDGELGKARAGGMTLREYAAVQIHASLMAGSIDYSASDISPNYAQHEQRRATRAVRAADELLKALNA